MIAPSMKAGTGRIPSYGFSSFELPVSGLLIVPFHFLKTLLCNRLPNSQYVPALRERYRYRLLIKAPRHMDMQGFLRAMIDAAPKQRASLRVQIDIDPVSFL